METLLQAVGDGMLHAASLSVIDGPAYAHRGLMIDTGRRFFPVPLVQSTLDAMAAMKMNVLHFHASDFCRFSVESKKFPALTGSLTGDMAGSFTQEDIAWLIKYAAERGIRVVPEFDMPGHAQGMDPLIASGLEFCTGAGTPQIQLYNDPKNSTVGVLKELLTEMAGLFPDEVFNIGCDETSVVGDCTLDNIGDLEVVMERHLMSLGKTPEGWEEVLFNTAAAQPGSIVDAWARHTAGEITAKGFLAVESHSTMYLNNKGPAKNYWWDIAPSFSPQQKALMLGGEASIWSDNFCYITQCGAFGANRGKPVGAALFPPAMDDSFAEAVQGLMWPNAGIAGGSFWNYNASLSTSSSDFDAAVAHITAEVTARGVPACPVGCTCDEVSRCGKPIVPPDCAASVYDGQNVGNYDCTGTTSEAALWDMWTVESDGTITIADGAFCLTVSSKMDPSSGSPNVDVEKCRAGDVAQVWAFDPATGHLTAPKMHGMCLDITAHSSANGANVEVFKCNTPTSSNQQWAVSSTSQPATITSKLNGYCLAVCK